MSYSKNPMGKILLKSAYELKEDYSTVEDIYLNAELDGDIPSHCGVLDQLCKEGTMECKVCSYQGQQTKKYQITAEGVQLVETDF